MLSTQTPLLQSFILLKICSFPSARGKVSREFPLSLMEVTQDVVFHIHQLNHLLQRADSLEDSDARKDGRQEEKGMTEDEMVGWHHRHNEHEFYLNSKSWRWTGRPGVLQSTGSQRAGHD